MLTRNQKNRNASTDKSCPKNSNESVPSNGVVEVGEMVMTDHSGTSGGLYEDVQRGDYLGLAWLSQEKLNDLVDGDKGEFPKLGLRSLLDMGASHNIISVDPKMLNPVLWRALPKELLLLVLARLPMPDIFRLGCLSKEWRRDMMTVNSEINQACDEASPTMIAVFSCRDYIHKKKICSKLLITICDLSTQRSQYSYSYHLPDPIESPWNHMSAFDGGLVCFVSTWRPTEANPMCIVVFNLLTRVQRKLPPLQYVYSTPPQMMHIEVDSKTKCYRVVVFGENMNGPPTVEIYHSGARQWTKATLPLGFIFGLTYTWVYSKDTMTFCSVGYNERMYDFAKGQLKRYNENGPSKAASAMAIWKDCKFVLHKNTSNGEMLSTDGHCITKYRIQTNAKDWVQERSYLCSPFEALLKETWLCSSALWKLKACEGFLMVFLHSYLQDRHFWLLNLSTGEWNRLPHFFEGHQTRYIWTSLCQAFWNVVP